MRKHTTVVVGSVIILLVFLGGCFGVDLESETFSCFGDEDCAAGFQCRLVEGRRVCMADDSDDVRLCEEYCTQFIEKCGLKAEQPQSSVFEDRDDCLEQCDALPTDGNMGDASNNTVQCRFWHIDAASQFGDRHCPHSWPLAEKNGCTGDCYAFCTSYQAQCGEWAGGDASSLAEDLEICRTDCREFESASPDELDDPPTGNSLACRQFYLGQASEFEDDSTEENRACRNARSSADNTDAQCR